MRRPGRELRTSLAELTLGVATAACVLAGGAYLESTLDRIFPAATSATIRLHGSAGTAVGELRRRRLLVPVSGVTREELRDTFADLRPGGRRHQALDIPAPRGRPVIAADAGTVLSERSSRLGGRTLVQVDPTGRYCYHYAHLESYAAGVEAGASVHRGQTLGYVGTSGNAPEDAPHLHFSISLRRSADRCGGGEPINPYRVLASGAE